jgi:hypothetical protein
MPEKTASAEASLEDILKKIGSLRTDLSAQVTIGSHYDHGNWVGGSRGGNNPGYYETEPGWITEYALDTQKIDSARKQLQQISDSSKWYSARYLAGTVIGLTYDKLEAMIKACLNELKKDMYATKESIVGYVPEIKIVHEYLPEFVVVKENQKTVVRKYQKGDDPGIDRSVVVEMKREEKPIKGFVPDEERRLNAVKDADMLLKLSRHGYVMGLLKEAYHSTNFKSVRDEAGKSLGYSRLRIYLHNILSRKSILEVKK